MPHVPDGSSAKGALSAPEGGELLDIYLDNAATSHPKPASVLEAVRKALTDFNANPGRSGHKRALAAGRVVLEARESLASLMGVEDPFSIIFQFNCTDALNLAIKGSAERGCHIISTLLEHNSVLRVLTGLQQRRIAAVTLVAPRPDGCIDPDDIRREIRRNTSLIVMTQASNVTGAIQPAAAVGRLAQQHGIRYLIDGAQALGSLPVDVQALKCDLYAFPGHKSLLGPQGTGGLYIRPGTQMNTLREGGTGSSSDSMEQPAELPERFESGTLNLPGIAGLKAGTDHVRSNLAEIFMRERELTQMLFEGLQQIPGITLYSPPDPASRAGIVSFNIADLSSSQAADSLSRANICVRGGLHCAPGAHQFLGTLRRGAVRASVGHTTTHEDIESLLAAVHRLQAEA